MAATWAVIVWLGIAVNIPMNFPSAHHPLRSIHAMRFCCALEDNQTDLFRFAQAAFDAYYTDQANLDDPDVLVKIADNIS